METTPELHTTPESGSPGGAPRLMTIAEAAAATGASRKALARRIERGTLRAVHDDEGRRVLPLAELVRAGLMNRDGSAGSPGGELVVWKGLYEREREEREQLARERELLQARERELHDQLMVLAHAGWFRAARLRRQVRQQLAG